jgi:uncharacterized membrane protein
VHLEINEDKLHERLHELRAEGDPDNEMQSLRERLASLGDELEALRREEERFDDA